MIWLAVAAGGALGSLLRYWMSTLVYAFTGQAFPWGTLAVNVVGSLAMGFLYVWFIERAVAGPEVRSFVLVGLLGAFTTFSTFSIETVNLLEQGAMLKAFGNMLLSVTACLAASLIGVAAGRHL